MQPVLVLAHAPNAEPIAQRIKDKLSALGYAVEHGAPATRRGQAARIEAAHKVVLLWSRAARGTPALRAAAQRARTKGTLVCVSLDAAPPPIGTSTTRLPRSNAAWRRLLGPVVTAKTAAVARVHARPAKARRRLSQSAAAPAPVAPAAMPRRRNGIGVAMMALFVLGVAIGVELYAQDGAFAARVNGLSNQLAAALRG